MDQEVGRGDVSGVVAADVHVRVEPEIRSQLPDEKDRRSDYCGEAEELVNASPPERRGEPPIASFTGAFVTASPPSRGGA